MSYQSGGHTGLNASRLCHGLRGGRGEWRDAHLQPDAHEEGFPADERPQEVRRRHFHLKKQTGKQHVKCTECDALLD